MAQALVHQRNDVALTPRRAADATTLHRHTGVATITSATMLR
jgi:hypothetical protein